MGDEAIQGLFYRNELVPTTLPNHYTYKSISSHWGRSKKQREYLVQCIGYPDKFNSYTTIDDTCSGP